MCHHFQQDIITPVGRLPELLTQGDSLQSCTTVALVHFTTTAVPEQYSLLLQVLSPVLENPELSLLFLFAGLCIQPLSLWSACPDAD